MLGFKMSTGDVTTQDKPGNGWLKLNRNKSKNFEAGWIIKMDDESFKIIKKFTVSLACLQPIGGGA